MISKYKKIYLGIGIILIVSSVVLSFTIPPAISPEFKGSSLFTINAENVLFEDIQNIASGYENLTVKEVSYGYQFETSALNDDEYLSLQDYLKSNIGEYTIVSFESFSPSISQELVRKSIIALILASIIIILYIAYTFSGVSRPLASWKYGFVATIALFHDVVVPIGIFAIISQFTTASIDTLFVTALLATLGYSVNDTIVIFDRIRERLSEGKKETFEKTVDLGVRQSVRRSIYTSLSTLIPLIMLSILVPVTQWFALALSIGVIAGTFSSLFFATSILLLWNKLLPQKDGDKNNESEVSRAEQELRDSLKGDYTI